LRIQFPFIADHSKDNVEIHENSTFEDLSLMIMERDPQITSINYQDPSGNILVEGEKLRDWKMFPVVMNVVNEDEFEKL